MWHEDSAANRRTGILLVSLATLSFSMLDTTVKWLLQLQTIPLVEIIWLRFLSQAVVSGVVLAPRYKGAMFRIQKKRLQLFRAVLLGTMTGCNFWSIQFLQLTETASILFSAPLIVAVISHFWL
ncbi:MAG: EamA family transporter, partial [Burkholderiaceae bacterium]